MAEAAGGPLTESAVCVSGHSIPLRSPPPAWPLTPPASPVSPPQDERDDDRTGLLYEERLERAERRRLAGNELFKQGRYKEALAKYALVSSPEQYAE